MEMSTENFNKLVTERNFYKELIAQTITDKYEPINLFGEELKTFYFPKDLGVQKLEEIKSLGAEFIEITKKREELLYQLENEIIPLSLTMPEEGDI